MRVSGTNFIIFLVCISVLERVFCGRKNELNVSKGDPSPMLFWPIQTSKHNKTTTTGKMIAILHDVELVSGPTTNAGILDALSFNGMPTSYVEIQNMNGVLNGDNALNWMFYVYNSNSVQSATLLEYHDGGTVAGFTLGISGSKLTASFYDHLGLSYNIQSTFSIPVLIWTFVGVNFNKLWSNDQFDLFMINAAGSLISETTGLGAASSVMIRALGSVVLGSNHLGNQNFEGKIACIQFSNKSQIKHPQEDAPELCDPNLWTDPEYGELTEDATITTLAPLTTTSITIITTTTTPEQTTTLPTTITAVATTTTTTVPPTTAAPTTMEMSTTTTAQVITMQTSTIIYSNSTALVCNGNDTVVCHCYTTFTTDELITRLNEFRQLLLVDKKTTSASIRLRTSASDDRASATAIGGFGAGVLALLFLGIILPDIIDLISYMHKSCQARTVSYTVK